MGRASQAHPKEDCGAGMKEQRGGPSGSPDRGT